MIANDRELNELLSLLREGLLSPQQEARLGSLLMTSDTAVRTYILSMSLHADLRGRLVRAALQEESEADNSAPVLARSGDHATDPLHIEPQATMYGLAINLVNDDEEPVAAATLPMTPSPKPQEGLRAWLGAHPRSAFGAAAALLLLAFGLFALFLPNAPEIATPTNVRSTPQVAETPTQPTPLPVALVTDVKDAIWQESSGAPANGEGIVAGTALELTGGSVRLSYPSGARVIIDAPARFTVATSARIDLASGRLLATVPPAGHGFTVRSGVVDVVDLGTAFNVDVSPERAVAIRVTVGQVEARPSPNGGGSFKAVRLAAGESALADASGIRVDVKPTVYATVRPANVTGGPSFPREDGLDQTPSRVLAGSRDSWWAGDPSKEAWELVFDFGGEVGVPTAKVDYFSNRYMAKQATVSSSSDGATWTTVGDLPPENPAILTVNRSARFLRINFTGKAVDKQPAIWSVTFPAIAEATTLMAVQQPAKPGAAKAWPTAVTEVRYKSSADQTDQPALFYDPRPAEPAPLLVALHTWSSDYKTVEADYARWCIDRKWVMIRPNFRGPNKRPDACGSELAVADILSAVDFAKRTTKVDEQRIYLVGVSGGGHAALLMAGRAPEVWAAVSAWCPIYDLAAWHGQTTRAKLSYGKMLEAVCGGPPGASSAVDAEYSRRSPATYIAKARGLPLDINTGIHDGHKGSVPISHALNAFNALAKETQRIPEADIASMVATQNAPQGQAELPPDELYDRAPVLYRKMSGNVRATVFDGGHMMLPEAALAWLEQQQKGTPAVWKLKRAAVFNASDGTNDAGK